MEMLTRFHRSMGAIVAGIAASFIVAATPTAAQDSDVVVRGLPEDTRIQLVSYRDLNLRYVAHLEILNDRVARAVRKVCNFDPSDRLVADGHRNCVNLAWAGARPQMQRAYLHANRLAYSGY
jgi:UrcA family protein